MACVYSVPEHKYFDSRQVLEKQRRIVQGELLPPPIMGNAVEQTWYDAIHEVICTKSKKLSIQTSDAILKTGYLFMTTGVLVFQIRRLMR